MAVRAWYKVYNGVMNNPLTEINHHHYFTKSCNGLCKFSFFAKCILKHIAVCGSYNTIRDAYRIACCTICRFCTIRLAGCTI